jgi:hypothetical protein
MYENGKRSIITFCQKGSFFSKTIKRNNFIRNFLKKGPLSTVTPFIIFAEEKVMEKMAHAQWNITPFEHDSL